MLKRRAQAASTGMSDASDRQLATTSPVGTASEPRTGGSLERRPSSARRLIHHVVGDSLIRNSGYIIATTVATSVLGYAYWLIAARLYPIASIGTAAALISAASMCSLLATLGMHFGIIQLRPRCRDDAQWAVVVNTTLITTTLAGALIAAVSIVFVLPLSSALRPVAHDPVFALLFIAQAALGTTSSIIDYVSVAERTAEGMLIRNVCSSVVRISLVALPVVVGLDARGILASWVVSNLALIVGSLAVRRRRRAGYTFSMQGWRLELRALVRLMGHHAINLGNMAPALLLPVVVASRLSAVDVAFLYTAWKVGGIFFMVSPAVASSLFAEGAHAEGETAQKVRASAVITAWLLVPLIIVFLIGGHWVLSMFGPEYASRGTALLMVLVLSAIPDAVTNIYVSVLRIEGRLAWAAWVNCSMAVAALVLAWVLLPWLGLIGAGVAWAVAQTAGSVVAWIDLRRPRAALGRAA
jgi:O-antigen/teichoic acid export membrane protein